MEDRYTLTDLPEVEELYWYIRWTELALYIDYANFYCDSVDYSRIAAGMAFKTQEAAERNKYAVYKALTGKEWKREDARHE